jgi:hypothetical protein
MILVLHIHASTICAGQIILPTQTENGSFRGLHFTGNGLGLPKLSLLGGVDFNQSDNRAVPGVKIWQKFGVQG